jgi:excisionase family DNA binding protein
MKDKLITVAQASEIAGVSVASIRRWTDSGRLKTYRSAGNHRRISRADLMITTDALGRLDRKMSALMSENECETDGFECNR